jgi:hypothetical protein
VLDFARVTATGWEAEGVFVALADAAALDRFAATFVCFFALEVFAFGFGAAVFESAEDVCANPARGAMQAKMNAKAQPAPQPRILAR